MQDDSEGHMENATHRLLVHVTWLGCLLLAQAGAAALASMLGMGPGGNAALAANMILQVALIAWAVHAAVAFVAALGRSVQNGRARGKATPPPIPRSAYRPL